jgi:hypothetical protein
MPKGIKWKYSQIVYLKLNYGRMTYAKMRKFMPEHSEKAISNKAVELGLSDKQNWNPFECIVAIYYPNKTGELLTNRSTNALKIKRCRLIKSLSN